MSVNEGISSVIRQIKLSAKVLSLKYRSDKLLCSDLSQIKHRTGAFINCCCVVVVRHWNIAVGWFALLGYGWFWQLLWFYNSLVIFRYQPKFYQIQKNILDGTKRQLLRIKKRYNLFEMEFPTFWWSRGEGRIWRQIMHAYLIFILSKSPYKSELFFKR